ncbi:hypothetical protein AS180_12905 [Priestia veravalensis]|uniref:D,D-heptose 1,7-bisphosphate phosphatase n=1 Tax=Priestia veravalensis TaxID=1414648 RepID=A0A0V8JKE8_9BACI|nr:MULTISPECIES: HAD-IIIA family hydrolase [Priestia]KSU87449.1 hypothetical protein AS180_12905 [Priestia veravalensis]SCC35774.1 histidinol-phosphate phosphatase family domain-containing protein/HAD-superfamily hydrolase, subfamily IIIA [Priestia flexa]
MASCIQAVFIDRDGTIGGDDTVHYPKDFTLFSFSLKTIHLLKEHNIKLFAFTNQPGISSGEATKNEFINELTSFGFDDFCICPHHHTTGCTCRKPSIGMLIEAARKHQLDLSKCVIIGDRWTDIEAGRKVGAKTILVQTGAGKKALAENKHEQTKNSPHYIATNLEEAGKWLLKA